MRTSSTHGDADAPVSIEFSVEGDQRVPRDAGLDGTFLQDGAGPSHDAD